MVNDLIPWVDRHFRTLADKDHRAMAGLSMGVGQTATITMVNLDKFSSSTVVQRSASADEDAVALLRQLLRRPPLWRWTSRPFTAARWPTPRNSTAR